MKILVSTIAQETRRALKGRRDSVVLVPCTGIELDVDDAEFAELDADPAFAVEVLEEVPAEPKAAKAKAKPAKASKADGSPAPVTEPEA